MGLANAYHGDTLGAADCVPPSVFNGPLQAPWYRGRGVFLEPPYVALSRGSWQLVSVPAWLQPDAAASLALASLEDVLAPARDSSALTAFYRCALLGSHQLVLQLGP